jgi:hypothetical protein
MSDLTNVFTDIANAIRAKTETTITYKPTEMANAINNIETGGGSFYYNANGMSIVSLFNMPIIIDNNVTNMFNTFSGCYSFNQPITIPNSVTNIVSIFSGCNNFNQPITIPDGVTSMVGVFYKCYSFNQPIIIPNSVTNM